jgi:hypothetical protein
MNKQETTKIIGVLMMAYPRYADNYKDINKLNSTIDLWCELLGDIPYNVANIVIQKLILTSEFPPTIADIRKQVANITNKEHLDSASAWGEVQKSVTSYGWNKYEEMKENVSNKTLQVIGMIGWTNICMCELDQLNTLRSQFMRMYDSVNERSKKDELLPDSLKEQIRLISSKMTMLGDGE